MKKLIDRDCHAMSRRLAIFRSMSRPSTFDPDDVANADMPSLGEVGVERNLRWAVVVRRPPGAGDDAGALRRSRGIGQATITTQGPGGFRRRDDVFDRYALDRHDACPHRRHLTYLTHARQRMHQGLELAELIVLDVDK